MIIEIEENKQWYVLEARHNGALKAQKLFGDLQIKSYVPMESKALKTKGGKVTTKFVPIFYNLIFAQTSFTRLNEIKALNPYLWYKTDGPTGNSKPMTVNDEKMQIFIDFIDGNFDKINYIDPSSFDLKAGERVRITDGPFKGKEGTFVKVKGQRKLQIVVAIDNLLAVTIAHNNPCHIIERI